MEPWIQMIITIICSVIASSGFWAYLQKNLEKKDVKTEMLIGLGHDRIIYLGLCYIERGWITQDEYENLNDYLLVIVETNMTEANESITRINEHALFDSTFI